MTTIVVNTNEVRAALRAVAPHAGDDPEISTYYRVRFEITGECVVVTATSGYTAGLATIEVLDNTFGDLTERRFDLMPGECKEILSIFRTDKDHADAALTFDINPEDVRITDTSGLFIGKSLSLPRSPADDEMKDVATVLLGHLNADPTMTHALDVTALTTNGELLGRFGPAAKAYGGPLTLEPVAGRAIVVNCADRFIGLLLGSAPGTPEARAERLVARNQWRSVLSDLTPATADS